MNSQNNGNKYTVISFEEQERRQKEDEFLKRLEELEGAGRFIMFSPSKKFCYIMGLIDYLGKWNMNKRLEMYGKTFLAHFIRQNTDFSVKPPHEFARRFLRKVKRIFRVQKTFDKNFNKQGSNTNLMDYASAGARFTSFDNQKRSFDMAGMVVSPRSIIAMQPNLEEEVKE